MMMFILLISLILLLKINALSFNNKITKKGFSPIETKLLTLLEQDGASDTRGASLSIDRSTEIEMLVSKLEQDRSSVKDPTTNPLIDGCWKLLYTSSPGTNSPIQRTFTGNSAVSVYQVVNLIDTKASFLDGEPDVSNVVCFGENARLRVTALASTSVKPTVIPRKGDGKIFGLNIFGISNSSPPLRPSDRIDFAFQDARFEFPDSNKFIPYPVPFKLLGDESKGWIDTTYLSPTGDFRIAKGNKGTTFILKRAAVGDSTALFAKAPSLINSDYKKQLYKDIMSSSKNRKKTKVAVILPAQLCSEDDYTDFTEILKVTNPDMKFYTCKLDRLNWVSGLLPSFFSKSYFEGTLVPSKTLNFYLKKVDEAVIQAIQENDGNVDVTLIAHSIGGWVSRAWISEYASPELRGTVSKVITLGSPHNPAPDSSIDQTRGLLKYITEKYPGAYEKKVKYYSVIGSVTKGNIGIGSGLLNTIQELLAYISYKVLSGNGSEEGDGLIPITAAALPGAELIKVRSAYHSDFIPSIGKSIKLNVSWYGSPEATKEWEQILRK